MCTGIDSDNIFPELTLGIFLNQIPFAILKFALFAILPGFHYKKLLFIVP